MLEKADGVGCGGCFTQDGRIGLEGLNILGMINSSGGGNGLGNILDVVLWGVARMAFLMGVFGRL